MMRRNTRLAGVLAVIAIGSMVATLPALAANPPDLTPTYGPVAIQPTASPSIQSFPSMEFIQWNDGGTTRNGLVRGYQTSADIFPQSRRIEYYDPSKSLANETAIANGANWTPARLGTPANPLLENTVVGKGATVRNLFKSGNSIVAMNMEASFPGGTPTGSIRRLHSVDGGKTWIHTLASIDMNGFNPSLTDQAKAFQGVIRLPDSSLVMPLYIGHRVYLLASSDEGLNWQRRATVFDSTTANYGETTIARRGDGRLLVVSRFREINSAGVTQETSYLRARLSTLPITSSTGITDTAFQNVHSVTIPGTSSTGPGGAVRGVAPKLIVFSEGRIALFVGRPDNKVAFSKDGVTWTEYKNFYQNRPSPCSSTAFTCWTRGSSGYMGVAKTGPRKVMLIGDNCVAHWGCTKHKKVKYPSSMVFPKGRVHKLWASSLQMPA